MGYDCFFMDVLSQKSSKYSLIFFILYFKSLINFNDLLFDFIGKTRIFIFNQFQKQFRIEF